MLQKVEKQRRLFDITFRVMIFLIVPASGVVSEAREHTVMSPGDENRQMTKMEN